MNVFHQQWLDDGILKIVFDLPDSRANIFNKTSIPALEALIEELQHRDDVRLVVFTSAKENIYIAGADVNEIFTIRQREEAYQKARLGQQLFQKWAALPMPTLAVINGACMGGGTEFSLAFDFRVATDSPKVRIGLPEVKLGVIPGWGGTQRLPRLIGLQNALKIILTGGAVDARRALKQHLVDEVVPHAVADEAVLKIARDILETGGKRYRERRKKRPFVEKMLEATGAGRSQILKKSREMVMKETRGHYPAPLAALEAVAFGLEHSLEEGLEYEARKFAEVAITDVSKNLIRIFFFTEEIKKENGVENPEVKPRPIKKIGILGAGVMGGGIAQLAAYRDHPVRLKDIAEEPLAAALAHARELFEGLVKRHRLSEREADLKMGLISTTTDYSGFENVDLVIEAVVEDVAIKKKVFEELGRHVPDEAIVASNTSAIPITELAEAYKKPDHFVGMHFFNPVHRMPLIEVIRGRETSDETVATIFALSKAWGKTPIVVNDGPGFLVNRLLMPYMAEAVVLLESGIPIPDIDRAMLDFGMPMGPLRLYDEVGIDVAYKAAKVMQQYFGDRIPAPASIEKMVQEKRLGKKTGRGFYLFSGKKGGHSPVDSGVYAFLGIKPTAKMNPEMIQKRLIYPMLNEAARCLEEGIATKPRDVDVGLIFGIGFPPFRGGLLRWAQDYGLDAIIADMDMLAREVGERYQPVPYLTKLAQSGGKFYSE